jgi:aminopeptidase N
MLRRRMGDERFFNMLAELCKRYRFKKVNTEGFRRLAVEFMPKDVPDRNLESFFEQWIFSTGIPTLKLNYSVKGKAPALKLTGTIQQSDVPDDFSALAAVDIQLAKGKSITRWVQTSDEPMSFTVNVPQPPVKVVLDPTGVLARR